MANNLEKLKAVLAAKQKQISNQRGPKLFTVPGGCKFWKAPFENDGAGACHQDCIECPKHFRPELEQLLDSRVYSDQLSAQEVRSISSKLTAEIFTDLEYLRGKIESQGNAILNRWLKKSEQKRRAIILKACPELYVKKAPQPRIYYNRNGWLYKRQFRQAFLLPYLTVDNLCDDKSKFLTLLFHRTQNEPEDWVMSDSAHLSAGYAKGSLEVKFNQNCVIMYGEKYGSITPYNRDAMHAWDIVGWPRAHLILEAQATLMHFLRGMVDLILDGHSGACGSDKWNRQFTTGFKARGGQMFLSHHSGGPFSAAAVFNPTALLHLANTRLISGEDELEALQTNPSYALMRVNQLLKLDYYKNLAQAEGDDAWQAVAHEFFFPALSREQIWRWVTQELTYVCELYEEYDQRMRVGSQTSEECKVVLAALQTLVKNLESQRVDTMMRIIPTLGSLQQHIEWSHDPTHGASFRIKELSQQDGFLKALFEQDPLSWALYQLQGESREVIEDNKSFYFNFIDDLIENGDAKTKQSIDQRTYDYLADIAAMDTIITALEHIRPRILPMNEEMAEVMFADRGGKLGTWRNCLKHPGSVTERHVQALGLALKDFVAAGWPKGRKTEAWLDHASRSYQALASFWTALHDIIAYCLSKSERTKEEIDHELSMTAFADRPSHLARLDNERNAILELREPKILDAPMPGPLSVQQTKESIKSEVIRNANTVLLKLEKKTKQHVERCEAGVLEYDNNDNKGDVLDGVEPRPSVLVNEQSLRTFNKMFGMDRGPTRDIRWSDFVAAMVDAGCVATQNGGSAVTFGYEQLGSIVYHRPHPDPTVNPIMLREMGRRLTKWFGWSNDSFQLRSKEQG